MLANYSSSKQFWNTLNSYKLFKAKLDDPISVKEWFEFIKKTQAVTATVLDFRMLSQNSVPVFVLNTIVQQILQTKGRKLKSSKSQIILFQKGGHGHKKILTLIKYNNNEYKFVK